MDGEQLPEEVNAEETDVGRWAVACVVAVAAFTARRGAMHFNWRGEADVLLQLRRGAIAARGRTMGKCLGSAPTGVADRCRGRSCARSSGYFTARSRGYFTAS